MLKTWLSSVKLYRNKKLSKEKQKLLRFSGRFEVSRVRVTEGKISLRKQPFLLAQRRRARRNGCFRRLG